ncbi:hypothetical protein [Reyranella sp.]|uniref:hypothetical protein n=1 Tax=Reyranella sp. TaxID=1929291 RepID=UPI003783F627
MRRLVPGLAIPVLVGVPLWMGNSWAVELATAASGVLCLVAVLRASLALATSGAALALLALALARPEASSPASVFLLVAFGSALLLLLDGTHLYDRFDGAEVARALWRRHIALWVARWAISLGIALVIAVVAPLIALALPHLWPPFVAGLGILVAFAAAVAWARRGIDG